MADIFISYSKAHPIPTEELAADLQAQGFSVWWDTSLVSGDSFREVILTELGQARAAVVIWTKTSVASFWVISEATRAQKRGILIPVRADDLDPDDIPPPFDVLHTDVVSNRAAILAALTKRGILPPAPKAPEPPPMSEAIVAEAVALEHWQSIKGTSDPDKLQEFLAEFGTSKMAKLARDRLAEIEAEVAAIRAQKERAAAEWQKRSEAAAADFAASAAKPRTAKVVVNPAAGRTGARAAPAGQPERPNWPWRKGMLIALALAVVFFVGSAAFVVFQQKPKSAPANDRTSADRSTPATAAAPKATLYEEEPSSPDGKHFAGTASWKTEMVSPGPNQPMDTAVRAEVAIPDRKLKMIFSFRRNTDISLPASHTSELTFSGPTDFPGGGIADVPGILMKAYESARGEPLAGLSVKVTANRFLFGLVRRKVDRDRNLALLKERAWFDIPIVYNNQRRAIMAMEKGEAGERAFADAFKAWGQ